MNPYSYENSRPEAELRLKGETSKSLHYAVEFPSAFPTGYPENGTVKGEYYLPKVEQKAPLAVLIHGMGDYSIIPCKLLARALLRQGIASFVPYLTVHSRRMPKAIRDHHPYLTSEEWFQSYQLSVIDIRQIVDWAGTRTELNEKQVATMGISFGGFASAIAMGIDSRIKAGVFIVTGGNSEKMMWLSKGGPFHKTYERSQEEYLDIQRSYTKYLLEVSEKGVENVTPGIPSFLTDPMTFAGYLKGRPVFMINAVRDKYIPREAVIEFWQACGEPTLIWIPSGHTSIWLWYLTIRRHITGFLKSCLVTLEESG
jgi:hypothetical protein